MTALPGIGSVTISVEGKRLAERAVRTPLLYYASARGLMAIPSSTETPDTAVAAFMTGPGDRTLTGLPRDVRLLHYKYDAADGLVSLDFSYTESVRTLALETPDIMRSVLLGLIASLTELPGVRAVRIDFDGHTRLGLGECSDLLGTRQPRPRLLNDERLLGR
jgi:spore germination protein GerM